MHLTNARQTQRRPLMSAFRNLERRKDVFDFHARAKIRVDVARHDTAVRSDHKGYRDWYEPGAAALILVEMEAMLQIKLSHFISNPDHKTDNQGIAVVNI